MATPSLRRDGAGGALLAERLEQLLELAGDADGPSVGRHLRDAVQRLREARFNLVVLGEFKRGKSTLINALLDTTVLPTGAVPLTSAITIVRGAERPRLLVEFLDGEQREQPLSSLPAFVTERENPANHLGVERALVELPVPLLDGGLQIVDTPGIGSVHLHNTAVAAGYVPSVDAALCVLSADQPLAEAEREFFRTAAERVPRLLVVVNKVDQVDPAARADVLEFVRASVRELGASREPELYAVSARTGDGVGELRRRIAELAEREGGELVARSVGRLAVAAASSLAQAARFEARAIELPLEELDRRAARFDARAAALLAAGQEAAVLLRAGVERLLRERVNEPLVRYAREHERELGAELDARLAALGQLPARELGVAIDRWIDEGTRERFERLVVELEAVVAAEVGELERSFGARVAEILVEIQDAAADSFGSRAATPVPGLDLSAPARFTFKLADGEDMLDAVVRVGRRAMPGGLGRRLVARDAQARLLHMTDRHAGRLRVALAERLREAVAAYERDLSSTVQDAVTAIRSAVARVVQDRARGADLVAQRRAALAVRAEALEALSDELARLVAGCA
jgi:small GTP-binding protein